MALFRSKKDIDFVKKIGHELIERIVGTSVTYYAISKKFTNPNFYGESKNKIFDPPVQLYALVEWLPQEVSTTAYGQDIIYNITVHVLNEHLHAIALNPKEGDMLEYDGKKFEATEIIIPRQFFAKENEDIGIEIHATSVRQSVFDAVVSASVDQAARTRPDEDTRPTYIIGDVTFAYSGSIY